MKKHRIGGIQKKILLLLLGGIVLGLSGSPKKYFQILKEIKKEWGAIDTPNLNRSIKLLYKSRFVTEKYNRDGTVVLILTKWGRKHALTYRIEPLSITSPSRWDRKWRIVIFDIPEKRKKIRDTFRFHLQHMGFHELQKSVFVHPFHCANEIKQLIKEYDLKKYVRYIVANAINNDQQLKKHFDLG